VVAVQVWRSMRIAGHGGTAMLLCGASAITGHAEASQGAHKIYADLVTLFLLPKPDERLQRAPATAW